MFYNLCLFSIFIILFGINVYFLERRFIKKLGFLFFILNEILKVVFKKFLDVFLFCLNLNFKDWILWKVNILKFGEI